MTKSIALSAAVLAAVFSFSPLASAKDQAAGETVQRAGERAVKAGTDTGQDAVKSADQIRARAEDKMDPQADQKFVNEAAAGNQFEVQVSQFVQQKSEDPQVKQLAQQIAQDHQKAQQQLQEAAKGMNVQVRSELMPHQQAKLQEMQQKTGGELDRAFVFGMVGDHHKNILCYQYEAQHAQNAQVKEYAQQTIPHLEMHLRATEQVAEQWVPQARTAGERIRGDRSSQEGKDQTREGTQGRTPNDNAGTNSNTPIRSDTNTGGTTSGGTTPR